ncbi:unnamed protein product [Orchesella dallaii]|uniref:Uncharacterized protein n=1 Tax=Orchesella dallaii TaxID=48710 RepID=A0ABP1QHZ7_9HEXA
MLTATASVNTTDLTLLNSSLSGMQTLLKYITTILPHRLGIVRFIATPSKIDFLSSSFTVTETHTIIAGLDVRFRDPNISVRSAVFVILEDLNLDSELETGNWNSSLLPNKTNLYQWFKQVGSRRRDHVIFVGKKNLIQKYWEHPKLNQLAWKWGLATDSGEIFASISFGVENPLLPTLFKDIPSLREYLKHYPTNFKMGHNIRGRTIRFTAWIGAPPYFVIRDVNPDGTETYDGTNFRIFNESFTKFNYTMLVQKTGGNVYSALLPNGTWAGMVANLYYDERGFDVCFYLSPQIFWYDILDFSDTVTSLGLYFVTLEKGPEIQWDAFLHPFQLNVWVMLISSCLLMVVFMHVSYKYGRNGIGASASDAEDGNAWFLWVITPYKIALEQNTSLPEGTQAQILSLVWFYVILITGAAYRTEIISSLTFPSAPNLPRTNAELAAATDYTVMLNYIGEVEKSSIETSKLQSVVELRKRLIYQPDTFECISEMVLNPKTICYAWCPLIQLVASEILTVDLKIDPYVQSNEALAFASIAVPFKKDSVYVDGFNPIILASFESGLYNFWDKDVFMKIRMKGYAAYKRTKVESLLISKMKEITEQLKDVRVRRPLTVEHFKMMFCILIGGLVIASISFVCEVSGVVKNGGGLAIFTGYNGNNVIIVQPINEKTKIAYQNSSVL